MSRLATCHGQRPDRALVAAALAALLILLFAAVSADAGGFLETYDLGNASPSTTPGFVLVDAVPIFWDDRCITVQYSMNDTIDPIPNPLGPPILSLADAQAALQDSFDSWNDVRTSYIDSRITGTTSNPGTRGFDFVNELTFRVPAGFGAIASSPSVSLIGESTLTDGVDVDGDGDSDVSNAITTCADVDSDGDVEFPEGTYAAGTILDNDVQFNTALRYTVDPNDADTVTSSVDLVGVATHEFGHSHGRSHVLNNQKADNDGSGATMFPFIDTGDPDAEREIRVLDSDDVAWASFQYPEGTASSGPAALQRGDRRFSRYYSVLRGQVTDGETGLPVAGASVGAFELKRNKLETTGFSGQARLAYRLADGALFFPADEAEGIIDGDYELPVRKGLYKVGMEPVDGTPVSPGSINFTVQVGSFFGQLDFEEEFFFVGLEDELEVAPGLASPLLALPPFFTASGVDLVSNLTTRVASFGSFDFFGFTGGPGGLFYAVQFPRAEVQAAFDSGLDVLHTALYRTQVSDASTVPEFAQAALVRGTVAGDGTATLNVAQPVRRARPFTGQDADFSPYFFELPLLLSAQVDWWLAHGDPDEDLFLILEVPEAPWPGPNGAAPAIGLDGVPGGSNDVPIFGRSFVSVDGGATFSPETRFNYMFALVLSSD